MAGKNILIQKLYTNTQKFKSLFVFFLLPLLILIISPSGLLFSQEIDILLKGGNVIDPANNISSVMDVAVSKGKIVKISPSISEEKARKVIGVSDFYVTPVMIDINTHVFVGSNTGFADGFSSVSPDDFTFKAGITTVVDAGTSGWRNFPVFKRQVIDRSQTRVLTFLNIAGSGMSGFP